MIKAALRRIEPAQIIISIFLLVLVATAWGLRLQLAGLLGDTLLRVGMNGLLVLSLVPMLRAGVGINYGLPVGILAGLVGMAISVEFRLTGVSGLAASLLLAAIIATIVGFGYAKILNMVRGNEEIVGTFLGFSSVYLMAIFWATAPFTNPKMLWPIGGYGLRPQVNLDLYFGKVLRELALFHIGDIQFPFGLLLFFAIAVVITFLYTRTRDGLSMDLAANYERFVKFFGANVERLRTKAIIQSTVLGAIGIVVYAATYGFLQLYDAPLMMAFPAAAAILIGGYNSGRVTVVNVILGAVLFNGILVFSTPIANKLLVPELAELMRTTVTNGVILYALVYSGRRKT